MEFNFESFHTVSKECNQATWPGIHSMRLKAEFLASAEEDWCRTQSKGGPALIEREIDSQRADLPCPHQLHRIRSCINRKCIQLLCCSW